VVVPQAARGRGGATATPIHAVILGTGVNQERPHQRHHGCPTARPRSALVRPGVPRGRQSRPGALHYVEGPTARRPPGRRPRSRPTALGTGLLADGRRARPATAATSARSRPTFGPRRVRPPAWPGPDSRPALSLEHKLIPAAPSTSSGSNPRDSTLATLPIDFPDPAHRVGRRTTDRRGAGRQLVRISAGTNFARRARGAARQRRGRGAARPAPASTSCRSRFRDPAQLSERGRAARSPPSSTAAPRPGPGARPMSAYTLAPPAPAPRVAAGVSSTSRPAELRAPAARELPRGARPARGSSPAAGSTSAAAPPGLGVHRDGAAVGGRWGRQLFAAEPGVPRDDRALATARIGKARRLVADRGAERGGGRLEHGPQTWLAQPAQLRGAGRARGAVAARSGVEARRESSGHSTGRGRGVLRGPGVVQLRGTRSRSRSTGAGCSSGLVGTGTMLAVGAVAAGRPAGADRPPSADPGSRSALPTAPPAVTFVRRRGTRCARCAPELQADQVFARFLQVPDPVPPARRWTGIRDDPHGPRSADPRPRARPKLAALPHRDRRHPAQGHRPRRCVTGGTTSRDTVQFPRRGRPPLIDDDYSLFLEVGPATPCWATPIAECLAARRRVEGQDPCRRCAARTMNRRRFMTSLRRATQPRRRDSRGTGCTPPGHTVPLPR